MKFRRKNNDIVELIFSDGHSVYNKNNLGDFESFISKRHPVLRLDLNGVLNTLNSTLKFNVNACCISYTGRKLSTRIKARREIQNRIIQGQIEFGVLVFKRGRGDNKYNFTEISSKAWIISLLGLSDPMIFIDDSYDHCKSVKSLNIPNLLIHHYNPKNITLTTVLKEFIV